MLRPHWNRIHWIIDQEVRAASSRRRKVPDRAGHVGKFVPGELQADALRRAEVLGEPCW